MLSAVPVADTRRRTERNRIRLEGDVPSPINPPPACRFHTRCWKAQEICRTEEPPLLQIGKAPGTTAPGSPTVDVGHQVACHFPEEVRPVGAAGEAPVSPAGR